jgi:hypothetical protein
MFRSADIVGANRYVLFRQWHDTHLKPLLWMMLNPSKADGNIDDATIRRCIDFSDLWGYGSLYVCNLNPYRSTNPNEMLPMPYEVRLRNTITIVDHIKLSDKIVCAWGTMGRLRPPAFLGKNVWHLGLTKEGYPKYPLYLPKSTTLTLWR